MSAKFSAFFCLLTTVLLITGLAAAQQTGKVPRIGVLIAGTPATMKSRVDAFREGLKALGWVDGQNVSFEYRYAQGKLEHLQKTASELVGLEVDVIVAASVGVKAAKKASTTVPIVMMAFGDDPVEAGLVASLAKPGGNVTGVINAVLVGKRLEVLKEAFPKASRVAVFWTPGVATEDFKQTQSVAQSLKLQIRSLEITKHADLDSAFSVLAKSRPDALFPVGSPVINSGRARIIEFAAKDKLPMMCPDARWVNDGALMSYSQDQEDQARRSAVYVDKILRGARPAELPVEAPRKFDLVINLRTAKQIGVMIEPNVLARADKVIR